VLKISDENYTGRSAANSGACSVGANGK
jgi:hypothetical protein